MRKRVTVKTVIEILEKTERKRLLLLFGDEEEVKKKVGAKRMRVIVHTFWPSPLTVRGTIITMAHESSNNCPRRGFIYYKCKREKF